MITLVPADAVEPAMAKVTSGSTVVVCGSDPESAAAAAARIQTHRTAVFVGNLADEADRRAVEEFCSETFGEIPETPAP